MRVIQGTRQGKAEQSLKRVTGKRVLGIVNVTLRLICLPKNLMRKSSDALQGSKRDTIEGILVESGVWRRGQADEDDTRSCIKLQMK